MSTNKALYTLKIYTHKSLYRYPPINFVQEKVESIF